MAFRFDFLKNCLYKYIVPHPLDIVKENLYKVPMATPKKTTKSVRTRRGILDMLKASGPRDAQTLAGELGITAMAVRQHLYGLHEQRLVEHAEEPRSMGRPAKMWRLTKAADRFFPDGHATLTVDLLRSVQAAFGKEGMQT